MNPSLVLRLCLIASVLVWNAAFAFASERTGSEVQPSRANAYMTTSWLDCNRVKLNLTNRGSLNSRARYGYGGGYWPDTVNSSGDVILFDFGPWVVGKVSGIPKMGLSQWGSSYSPGPAINGQAAMLANPSDSARYRIYRISLGDTPSTNPDYREWPADLGAPVDPLGHPRLYGNQTLWSVFNNLDPTAPSAFWQTHMPNPGLPIEIRQTIYAQSHITADSAVLLNNVAFVEWQIVNVGAARIESTFVSLWTDIDFNDASGNRPAIDTVDQLGYCWQISSPGYSPPRAVGFVLLYGPAVPDGGSAAVYMGRPRTGYRNLPLSSFWGILDDSYGDTQFQGPAYSMATAWNIARGLDKLGNPVIDSATHELTRFPYGGDPVTGAGWIATRSSGGAGFNMFTGPFTLAPGDSQWVMFALLPVSDSTAGGAIQRLRGAAATLRGMDYEEFTPSGPGYRTPPLPSRPHLDQNYPNPFNPNSDIRFQIAELGNVTLAVYDLLGRKVAVLVDEIKAPGTYQARFNASGFPSGVYFYRLQAGGFAETKKMVLIR